MHNKKYILIGNYPPPYSGQSIAFKIIVDEFSNRGESFDVINIIERNNSRSKISRIIVYIKSILLLILNLSKRNVVGVYHIISSSNVGFLRDFLIINIVSSFNKKIILHSHNGNYNDFYDSKSRFFKKLVSSTLNKSSIIIILSEKLRETFYFIKDEEKFLVVPNGLPIDMNIKKIQTCNSEINILYLSNLIESKGYLDVLNAAIILKKEGKINRFHFHFAGDFMLNPPQDKSYQTLDAAKSLFTRLIDLYQLNEYVSYYGIVDGDVKTNLLANADIFLLPTYYNVEAQPITIIEAMAFSTAIFSTDYRGISEMIRPNINGVFILPNSPENIAAKLKSFNKRELKEMGLKSYEIYSEKYTKKHHTDNMQKIIRQTFDLND